MTRDMERSTSLPIFEAFPALRSAVGYTRLAALPTPVESYRGKDAGLQLDTLLLKRDDRSGRAYGGNKVRKLEFLLGDALRAGARGVVTFGVAGSNHALATSIYARACGLDSYSMLTRQSNAAYVRKNLLTGLHAGARLIPCDSEAESIQAARGLIREADGKGDLIVSVPGGGSSPLGCLGFVNAGLELAEQIREQSLPQPDRIYLALGTVGTVAGLLLGLRLAGLSTQVTAVRVVREDIARPERIIGLLEGAGQLLGPDRGLDIGLPEIRHEFFGPGYARFTPEGVAAMEVARRTLGLKFEGTYTGKAFAALLEDCRNGRLEGKNVLFWNTYNSVPPPPEALARDYRALPEDFHYYFRQPLQPLDPEAGEDASRSE